MTNKSNEQANTPAGAQFAIQRLYVTDMSFEAPGLAKLANSEWKPQMNLDLQTKSKEVGNDSHEVILRVTVTVKNEDETAFLAEVQQAGVFTIKDFVEDQIKHTLGSFCPNILYPYAREAITDMVGRGGFPQLVLAPVNFDALYAQQKSQEENQTSEVTE